MSSTENSFICCALIGQKQTGTDLVLVLFPHITSPPPPFSSFSSSIRLLFFFSSVLSGRSPSFRPVSVFYSSFLSPLILFSLVLILLSPFLFDLLFSLPSFSVIFSRFLFTLSFPSVFLLLFLLSVCSVFSFYVSSPPLLSSVLFVHLLCFYVFFSLSVVLLLCSFVLSFLFLLQRERERESAPSIIQPRSADNRHA